MLKGFVGGTFIPGFSGSVLSGFVGGVISEWNANPDGSLGDYLAAGGRGAAWGAFGWGIGKVVNIGVARIAGRGRPPLPPNPCFVEGTSVWTPNGEAPIESLQVGDRVQTSHTVGKPGSAEDTIASGDYCVVSLELVDGKDSAQNVRIELLRPRVWLHQVDADVGKIVWTDLDHARIHGRAIVRSISPCPDIQPGQGRIVAATIRTTNAVVLDAKFEGCSETIGVTPAHPFWSEDRNAWVSAAKLIKGERVASAKLGSARLVEIAPRPSRATVYNIEVADDHEYLVASAGLRAHNDCPGVPVDITLRGRPVPPANTFPSNPNSLLPGLPRTIRPNGGQSIYPNQVTRIRIEQHPLKPGGVFAPRHHGLHYHVETRPPGVGWGNPSVTPVLPPGYRPGDGTGFLPGERIPGM